MRTFSHSSRCLSPPPLFLSHSLHLSLSLSPLSHLSLSSPLLLCLFFSQVNWQQERFQEILTKLGHFLKQAGFKVQLCF